MRNGLWTKGLVFGIILLLAGTSIVSSTYEKPQKVSFLTNIKDNTYVELSIIKKRFFKSIENSPIIVYVDDNFNETTPGWGYDHFDNIQDGIYAVSEKGTVYVYNGTYNQIIYISKSINLIGEDRKSTIIDCTGLNNHAIQIHKSNVTIQKFTLTYSRNEQSFIPSGIIIGSSFIHILNVSIIDLIITKMAHGIVFETVSNLTIINCNFHHNYDSSIFCMNNEHYPEYFNNITIMNCIMNNNGEYLSGGYYRTGGISINFFEPIFSNLKISECIIYDNIGMGIHIASIKNVRINNNHIYGNSVAGIVTAKNISNLIIDYNNIHDNHIFGISLEHGQFSNASILKNNITHNGNESENEYAFPTEGGMLIDIETIADLIIKNNNISDNNNCGMILAYHSSGVKVIENNFIKNQQYNAYFIYNHFFSGNQWNNNYWGKSRFLPKPIIGYVYMSSLNFIFPWLNIDWHPAKEPYDIPGMS